MKGVEPFRKWSGSGNFGATLAPCLRGRIWVLLTRLRDPGFIQNILHDTCNLYRSKLCRQNVAPKPKPATTIAPYAIAHACTYLYPSPDPRQYHRQLMSPRWASQGNTHLTRKGKKPFCKDSPIRRGVYDIDHNLEFFYKPLPIYFLNYNFPFITPTHFFWCLCNWTKWIRNKNKSRLLKSLLLATVI